jgi:hypothetical protein
MARRVRASTDAHPASVVSSTDTLIVTSLATVVHLLSAHSGDAVDTQKLGVLLS